MRLEERRALLLSASYEAVAVVTVARAFCLIFTGKADLLEVDAEQMLRSATAEWPLPVVVKLRKMVKIPYRRSLPLTRRALFARDDYRCAYCGVRGGMRDLTIDHVIPRSQGGRHNWQNVVACCRSDNHHKADRTPEQAGMTLRIKPFVPEGPRAVTVLIGTIEPQWRPYLISV